MAIYCDESSVAASKLKYVNVNLKIKKHKTKREKINVFNVV